MIESCARVIRYQYYGRIKLCKKNLKNSAVCVRTRTVNVNTLSTTVKDEISEGW